MAEKPEPKASQQQPFDSSFKALLDDQTKAMLSFLFDEEIEEAKELKEGVLKEGNQPSLRVDCAYRIKSQGQEEEYVGHVEFETSPAKKEIEARLLEYFGGLYRKYKQAIEAMKELYAEEPGRFGLHLLCFWTFLRRTRTVTREDKERIEEKMEEFGSLLDDNPFVERKKAEAEEKGRREGFVEGEARGEAKGFVEGEAKGLQESVVTIVEVRFPPLTELAQQRIARIDKPDTLKLLLKGVVGAPDEATARWVLDTLAA